MASIAYAAPAAATGGAGLASFVPLILIFLVFYFMLIRPQQKQAKEHQSFIDNLKNGAEIVTKGGIIGKVTGMTDTVITIEIAKNTRVKLSRSAVAGSVESVTNPPPAKKGG